MTAFFDILTAIIRKMNELRRPNAAHPCKNQKSYHFAFVWGRLNAADEFFCRNNNAAHIQCLKTHRNC